MLTRVRIASVFWFCRSSGSKSKRSSDRRAIPPTASSTAPPAQQKAVERSGPAETDRFRLAARAQQRAQRRQQREGQGDADDHADPGDQAEFGNADIGGRQKREKADRGRRRGKQQGAVEGGRGALERGSEIAQPIALAAIADGELDREVGGEADEQDRKGDRDQVQGADRDGGETGRQGEPGGDRGKDRQDELGRTQREEQDRAD